MISKDEYFERCTFALEMEQEIEEGVFAAISEEFVKCAYCGYEILPGEEAVKVGMTNDIIHRQCWCEYAEDNCLDLCTPYTA